MNMNEISNDGTASLTPRLAQILGAVIEYHVATGKPVGSRFLCQTAGFEVSASTVRGELAKLERLGFLTHPHTSAGRVPTDEGYRFYVDTSARERLSRRRVNAPGPGELEGEIEDSLRQCAALLARATGLLALVSAPSQDSTAIKHVEVLQLHPEMLVVVIITASGGVAKKMVIFDDAVDPGLVNWARSYLNEAVEGLQLGSRRVMMRLEEPGLTEMERSFLASLAPAFGAAGGARGLYVDGVSSFFSRLEADGNPAIRSLMQLLDRQEEIVELLGTAISERRVYLRIGREMPGSAMRGCSLVAANYGLAHRNLGTVGVLGPTRMDYPSVIGSVELTARSLSRLVEEIYN
ncbi:MAG: heat-inducible transcriptional repressor HrcA [Actinobacteria bacterium]|nr:heat-inducible transcriptional repressor HrcA [Actinomycetota bacterium]